MLSVTRVLSWKLCVPLHLISNNSQTLKFWWKCYARWIRQTARDFVNALWTKHCIGGASKADGHPLLLVVGRTPAGPISEYSAPWSPSTTTSYTQKRQKFLFQLSIRFYSSLYLSLTLCPNHLVGGGEWPNIRGSVFLDNCWGLGWLFLTIFFCKM